MAVYESLLTDVRTTLEAMRSVGILFRLGALRIHSAEKAKARVVALVPVQRPMWISPSLTPRAALPDFVTRPRSA
jgi:hypothetical protein